MWILAAGGGRVGLGGWVCPIDIGSGIDPR
jgi:hypothetical protein